MGIQLGLSRVVKLLQQLGNPHLNSYKTIHVAGTNGKGSTVAFLSSILTQAKIKNGRFTSPYLLCYNDSVSVNNEAYPASKFKDVIEVVKKQNELMQIGCSEFEILAATAFKIFELEGVEIALVEVGLGGRLDATNVLQPYKADEKISSGGVIATGITKIGLDHVNVLGNSLRAISAEKAGILKKNVPCVLDRTNHPDVLDVFKRRSSELNSELYLVDGRHEPEVFSHKQWLQDNSPDVYLPQDFEQDAKVKVDYQLHNLAVSLKLVDILNLQKHKKLYSPGGVINVSPQNVRLGLQNSSWPGRLQHVTIAEMGLSFLLDGAHNQDAARGLAQFLRKSHLGTKGIIFVVALGKGKSISEFLRILVDSHYDTLFPTVFTTPENMPWVSCYSDRDLINESTRVLGDVRDLGEKNSCLDYIFKHISYLREQGDTRPVVVCGSLYLCSDVLRYVDGKIHHCAS